MLRLISALGALFLCATSALASGTIPLSMTTQFDNSGKLLSGGLLYFIQAGTVATPQSAYQDSDLSIAYPNPITLDASARVPQLFLADGTIKIRLTDKDGNTLLSTDNILVVGPSSGSGGGGSVDATTVFTTGDVKASYRTGALSGWVRMNGRTIGSATSGATERANLDTEALFLYLWGADSNLTVSGGRGVSAAADWAANKTITLPDARGRALAALDDMGTTAAGRLTSTYLGTGATTLGAAGGSQSSTIAQTNLPAVTLSTAIASGQGSHTHTTTLSGNAYTDGSNQCCRGYTAGGFWTGNLTVTVNTATLPAMTGTTPLGGDGTALSILPPMMLFTVYVKL